MTTSTPRASGRKRLIIAGGALLGVVALSTAAFFADYANVNLNGSATGDGGIGGNNSFEISVAKTNALGVPEAPVVWTRANTAAGINYTIPGADVLAPGGAAEVTIPVKNTSPKLKAGLTISIQDTAGKTSDLAMKNALRYTVTLNGTTVYSDMTQAQLQGKELYPALKATALAADTEAELKIKVSLVNGTQTENDALNGKSAYVQAHLDAESVNP